MSKLTPSQSETTFAERLKFVQSAMECAANRAGRSASDITLIGVSKTAGRDAADAAYGAGLRHFGENRVQDAAAKFAAARPDGSRLHMIGQLQSNKAKLAVQVFDVIESVDRPSVIAALRSAVAGRERPFPILLQVNIAREPQKSGCAPEDVEKLVATLIAISELDLQGLMTIAPLTDDPEDVRPVFAGLRDLRDALRNTNPGLELPTLSMGMSNDFAVAIEEGATHVRVGRALFHG